MTNATPESVAALLKGLRVVFKDHMRAAGHNVQHPPLVAAEALLWIAEGVDHQAELAKVMGIDQSTASRTIALLRGRARWKQGKQVQSPYGLVDLRKHPHRRGFQLQLTQNGLDLLASTFAPAQQKSCTPEKQRSCESP